ncbi:MAG: PspA/IM30 family protein [Pseudomonadota bacterium]
MMRVAIQFKELISSNVTSVIETASNPVKMLNRLQREIEEAIIALQREHTLATQRKARLEAQLTQTEMREADWSDKAKTAMDHGREDLARQALIAREDCTANIAKIKDDIATAETDLAEIETAIADLEAKREDTREQVRQQASADAVSAGAASAPAGTPGTAGSKADAHLGRITELEKRTAFATEDHASERANASVDQEIEEMRRASKIEAELAAMKDGAAQKAPAKKRAVKKG